MKKLPAASGKANGHEWINTDTALQNTPLSPKLSPFTLIELLVVIAQYCRNHVKVLYDRIGMQAAGGGALAGNTVNAMNTMNMSAPQKPAMWQKNNKYCTSLRPTGRTSRLTQSSSSHLHTPKAFFTQSAFTLIELLVVIAMIAITTSSSIRVKFFFIFTDLSVIFLYGYVFLCKYTLTPYNLRVQKKKSREGRKKTVTFSQTS